MHISRVIILIGAFLIGVFHEAPADRSQLSVDLGGLSFLTIIFFACFLFSLPLAIFGRFHGGSQAVPPSLRAPLFQNRSLLQFPLMVSCIFLANAVGATVGLALKQQSLNDVLIVAVASLGLFVGVRFFGRLFLSHRKEERFKF